MAYVPKNKIQTGLYTDGNLPNIKFRTKSGASYVGPYYILYNGKYFSGQNPNSLGTKEIFPISDDNITNSNTPKTLPTPYSPLLPTLQDYANGEFIRYFVCRRNQPLFIETDKVTFTKYKQKDLTVSYRLYKPFSLFWVLTGDINQVAQTNKKVTELIEIQEKVFGLGLYLKENWTQYYVEKI